MSKIIPAARIDGMREIPVKEAELKMDAHYKLIGLTLDGMAIIENTETHEIKKVPAPAFRHGEIVSTSKGHFSQKDLTRVVEPTYNDGRRWIYGESYLSDDGRPSGSGFWNEEELFEKPQTLELRLRAKKIELKIELETLERQAESIKKEMGCIAHALDI